MRTAIAFLALAVSLAAQTPRYPIQGSSGGGGGGATIASTSLLIKGDGAGNGIAAAGTDVCALLTLIGDVTSSAACATVIANAAVTAVKMVNAGVHTGDCITTFPNCTITAGAITAAKMVNSGVFTGDATSTFPALTIGNGAITAVKMVNAGVMTGDVTTTFPAVTVAKVNGNTPGGTCTNQFVRSLSSSAVPTCASIANADLPTLTYTPSIFGGAALLPDSSGNAFCAPNLTISGTPFFLHLTCQFLQAANGCVFGTFTVPGNYTATTTSVILDYATTATSGNAALTWAHTDIGSTTSIGATSSGSGVLSATPTATNGTAGRVTSVSIALTAADFTANHTAQYQACRVSTSDTIAATIELINVRFSYVGRP